MKEEGATTSVLGQTQRRGIHGVKSTFKLSHTTLKLAQSKYLPCKSARHRAPGAGIHPNVEGMPDSNEQRDI